MLSMLIERGVDIQKATTKDVPEGVTVFEWRGCAGTTPLMIAVQKRSLECIKLLLARNVDINATDSRVSRGAELRTSHSALSLQGKSAIHYADEEVGELLSGAHTRVAFELQSFNNETIA